MALSWYYYIFLVLLYFVSSDTWFYLLYCIQKSENPLQEHYLKVSILLYWIWISQADDQAHYKDSSNLST